MITTVTLNTSLDKLYLVEKLEDYTVMRVKKVSNTAGGKGLNVSKVAYLLGEKVSALGFAGGFNGSYVSSLLEAQGIRAGFTRIQAETRSCINIRELSTGRHTEFLEPGAPVTHAECDEFLSGYRKTLPNSQVVTISGSVPAGVEVDFYGKLVSLAKQGGIPVIVDTSGALLAETVKAKPTMSASTFTSLEGVGKKSSIPAGGHRRRLGAAPIRDSLCGGVLRKGWLGYGLRRRNLPGDHPGHSSSEYRGLR